MRNNLDRVAKKNLKRRRYQRQVKPDAVTLLQAINVGIAQVRQASREGYDAEIEIRIDF